MENGIETGNVMRYNLGIFVKPSSSTLNVDITPGIYWITNANNTVSHNAAAGGTHFGYWYQMFDHPDGPSFTTSICPRLAFNINVLFPYISVYRVHSSLSILVYTTLNVQHTKYSHDKTSQ